MEAIMEKDRIKTITTHYRAKIPEFAFRHRLGTKCFSNPSSPNASPLFRL